jgi:hypothetical protein
MLVNITYVSFISIFFLYFNIIMKKNITSFEQNNILLTIKNNSIEFTDNSNYVINDTYFNNIQFDNLCFNYVNKIYHLALCSNNDIDIYQSYNCNNWNLVQKYNNVNCTNMLFQYNYKNDLYLIISDNNNIIIFSYNVSNNTWILLYNKYYHEYNILFIQTIYNSAGFIYLFLSDTNDKLNICVINEKTLEVLKIKDNQLDNNIISDYKVDNNNVTIKLNKESEFESDDFLIDIFLNTNTETTALWADAIDFLLEELKSDYGSYMNSIKLELTKMIKNNYLKLNNYLIKIDCNDIFYGYTSMITKYSIPKLKDNFDIYPFIRDKNNNIYQLDKYNINDTILCHFCIINNKLYSIINKKWHNITYSAWSNILTKEQLSLNTNTNIFNYSGDTIKIFSNYNNLSLGNNNSVNLELLNNKLRENYIPLIDSINIRYGQNQLLYNYDNSNPNNNPINNKPINNNQVQYVIIGYVSEDKYNMFPLDYDDERLTFNKYFTIRYNGINYFPNSIPTNNFKIDDHVLKLFLHKNISGYLENETIIGAGKLIRSEVIFINQNNNEVYKFKSIYNKNIELNITNLNFIFFNRTNAKINGEIIFTFLLAEKEISIDKNEIISILMEEQNIININSINDYNIETENDLYNVCTSK